MATPDETFKDNSNSELKQLIGKRFQDLFFQTLSFLEIAFPHDKGDGSDNEKRFNIVRSKILRIGNDGVRELDKIFNNYLVLKLTEYKAEPVVNIETQIFDLKNRFQLGGKANGTFK